MEIKNCNYCRRKYSGNTKDGLCQVCEKVDFKDLLLWFPNSKPFHSSFVITQHLAFGEPYQEKANNEQINCFRLSGFIYPFKLIDEDSQVWFTGLLHQDHEILNNYNGPIDWAEGEFTLKFTLSIKDNATGLYVEQ